MRPWPRTWPCVCLGPLGSSGEAVPDKYLLRRAACRGSAGLLHPSGMRASWGRSQKRAPKPRWAPPPLKRAPLCCAVSDLLLMWGLLQEPVADSQHTGLLEARILHRVCFADGLRGCQGVIQGWRLSLQGCRQSVVLQPRPCSAAGCHRGVGPKEWEQAHYSGTCCPGSSLEELEGEEGLSGSCLLSCCLGGRGTRAGDFLQPRSSRDSSAPWLCRLPRATLPRVKEPGRCRQRCPRACPDMGKNRNFASRLSHISPTPALRWDSLTSTCSALSTALSAPIPPPARGPCTGMCFLWGLQCFGGAGRWPAAPRCVPCSGAAAGYRGAMGRDADPPPFG